MLGKKLTDLEARAAGRSRTSASRKRSSRSTCSRRSTRCSGPEMRSTGEVLGHGRLLRAGLLQGAGGRQAAAARRGHGADQPSPRRTPRVVEVGARVRRRSASGSRPRDGTQRSSPRTASPAEPINKMHEGRPQHRRRDHEPARSSWSSTRPAGTPQPVRRLLHPQGRHQATRCPTSRRWPPRWRRRRASPPTVTAAAASSRCRSTTPGFLADRASASGLCAIRPLEGAEEPSVRPWAGPPGVGSRRAL